MRLNVYKVRKGAKLPRRAHEYDAGADVFYCPTKEGPGWPEYLDVLAIDSGESVLVPTGIKVGVPEGFMLEVKNKSGIAYKRQLVVGSCVIDSKYDGEIFVNLHNTGNKKQLIKSGEKVAQVVLIPISVCEFTEIEEDAVYDESTSRGDGGFGSTGDF